MSTFELPLTSSPALFTPKSQRKSFPKSSAFPFDYSTTPAGPPPSSRSLRLAPNLISSSTTPKLDSSFNFGSPVQKSSSRFSRDVTSPPTLTSPQHPPSDLLLSQMHTSRSSPPATIDLPQVAQTVLRGMVPGDPLQTPPGVIDHIDELLVALHNDDLDQTISDDQLATSCSRCSQQLCKIFGRDRPTSQTLQIGPVANAFAQASFVASLLLPIHQPDVSVPKTLLEWLNVYHNPWDDTVAEVQRTRPSPATHPRYWDIIFLLVLRGKLRSAVILLVQADFSSAESAAADGHREGYSSVQLRNIQSAVAKAAELLEASPAVRNGSWDLLSAEWNSYRQLVKQSLDELIKFAEDRPETSIDQEPPSNHLSHSQRARRAASRVPWTIYIGLRTLYGIFLGKEAEIISCSQNWLEASVGLTVWWDGEHKRSAGYLGRLRTSFREATRDEGEEDFQVNTNNAVEVALACVFEAEVETILRFLCKWSLPVADAVAEVAVIGQWLSLPVVMPSSNLLDLDPEDLAVLGQPVEEGPLTRDAVLREYSRALVDYDKKDGRPAWELALSLLRRLQNSDVSQQEMAVLLRQLRPTTDLQIHNILGTAESYGLVECGRQVAETYADTKLQTSIGSALVHYARAHAATKIHAVIDLLTALSLLHSSAFPATTDLDVNLQAMINSPHDTLMQIADMDEEAAKLLHLSLAPYAALRAFYESRQSGGHGDQLTLPLLAVIEWTVRQGPVAPLLCLLGELLYLVRAGKITLTSKQIFMLLQALEDLENVQEGPQQFLQAALRASPQNLPSLPDLFAQLGQHESSFELVTKALPHGKPKGTRKVDWRQGLDTVGPEDLMRLLRVVLARQIAATWIEQTV